MKGGKARGCFPVHSFEPAPSELKAPFGELFHAGATGLSCDVPPRSRIPPRTLSLPAEAGFFPRARPACRPGFLPMCSHCPQTRTPAVALPAGLDLPRTRLAHRPGPLLMYSPCLQAWTPRSPCTRIRTSLRAPVVHATLAAMHIPVQTGHSPVRAEIAGVSTFRTGILRTVFLRSKD